MNFRSVSDMSRVIYGNVGRIPPDIEIVVGVPRSGMLAANLIALALDRPLAALDDFLQGRVMQSGRRRTFPENCGDRLCQKVLLVDDAVSTGAALEEVRQKIAGTVDRKNVTILCVFGAEDAPQFADIVLETYERPAMFEWNFMHHPHLRHCCVDIDGVLCRDALLEEDDDGPNYRRFLVEANPLFAPTKKIGWLVSSRLEKYRAETEDWLARHNVDYGQLLMLDLPDAVTRRRLRASGKFKGEVFKSLRASKLFIESSTKDSQRIVTISGKPTLCIEGLKMYKPGNLSPRNLCNRAGGRFRRRLRFLRGAFAARATNRG